jgi:hypothetical protein
VKSATVAVEHVPILDLTPSETATPEVPREEESWNETPTGEPLILSESAWADLYLMPSEAVSLALAAPQLRFSEETCRLQGTRISRYCLRHNVVLPPYIDAVPIAGRAIADYGKLLAAASLKMSTKKAKVAAGEQPPSSSEHEVSSEVPSDIEERIKKTLTERRS